MLNKTKGCVFGLFLGTILKGIFVMIKFAIAVITKILVLLGLWIPLLYAIFGVILYFIFDFNPFDFSLYSTLYLSGALACVVCSLIVGVKNIIIRPTKSVYDGFRHPLWEKHREKNIIKEEEEKKEFLTKKERKELSPSDADDFATQKSYPKKVDFLPPKYPLYNNSYACPDVHSIFEMPKTLSDQIEKPKVYLSKLEKNLLVHEYADRYELFKIENNNSILDRVEYK